MSNNFSNTKDSFQIFLTDRNIPDPDELLGKALKYLKDKGKSIEFKGFDKDNTPIVQIDDTLYKFDKWFGPWQSAKFTETDSPFISNKFTSRRLKIESFYLQ